MNDTALAVEPPPATTQHRRLDLAIVVPTFNEQDSLQALHDAITESVDDAGITTEIIFVDDGSSDQSWLRIEQLVAKSSRTHGVKLRRNFGKAAALEAGIAASTGRVIITMDADLQDDPQEIPRFMQQIDQGLDVVSGWKKVRHDPWHKVWPSRVFNRLVSGLTGVQLHDHNCGFKAYRREVFDEVRLYGERHRFVPVLAAERGWKVGEIVVQHHARPFGQSKYGVSRILKGFLDLLTIYFITSFGKRPLHLIGGVGVVCFAVGAIGMLYMSMMWVLSRTFASIDVLHLHETAIFYYCILAVLLGAQFMLAGLLAELIVSQQPGRRPAASVAKRVGFRRDESPDHRQHSTETPSNES
ncbi:glycosyltransferase family 2 protein [Crateriforma spongiae]|uniref:glycosyltransferase family 2 protein n=1 Tax=Crateriforma spongiae TaxID=2724528 RepID=UPI001448727E|nr:glycosyltransferase family 2 protein [Crateriforma spongiae]